MFEAHGQDSGKREENASINKALQGSAQLQAGAENENSPASAFEEVTRPIQMLRRLRALFLAVGVGIGVTEGHALQCGED